MKTACQERFLPEGRTPPQVLATFVLKTHLKDVYNHQRWPMYNMPHTSYWTDISSKRTSYEKRNCWKSHLKSTGVVGRPQRIRVIVLLDRPHF